MILAYCKRNQIVFLPPLAIAGIAAPIGLIGTMVLQNTEILTGIALVQLINPGNPIVYIVDTVGDLDSMMTTCYEKMIIDEEIISRVLRIREGVDTSEIELSVDAIQEIAHSGHYLMHQMTLNNYKKRWTPTISYWDGRSENLIEKANRKYKEILKDAPESLIDSALEKEL
jgi:trimethylamine:corrinoid methyltransferase-like protein